jgi:LEA14-like dessication related protein
LETGFPILYPLFSISSIQIIQDELINTKMCIEVSIENENNFPLYFSNLQYTLFGEKMFWTRGSNSWNIEAPCFSKINAEIYITMNFTEMNRSVFDKVVKLGFVEYRFFGDAAIEDENGVSIIFPFDLTGLAQVIR